MEDLQRSTLDEYEEADTLMHSLKTTLSAARLLGYTVRQEFGTDLTDPEAVFVIAPYNAQDASRSVS